LTTTDVGADDNFFEKVYVADVGSGVIGPYRGLPPGPYTVRVVPDGPVLVAVTLRVLSRLP